MISVNDAKNKVEGHTPVLETETVQIQESLGRFLAEDVYTNIPSPVFDNSAMDGFAISSRDINEKGEATFEIVGVQKAGRKLDLSIGAGQAVKIMTGAPMPEGADTVVMRESSREDGSKVHLSRILAGSNVRKKGEEIKAGDCLFKKGSHLTERSIGLFASFGIDQVKVTKRPTVDIIVTGDELVKPPGELKLGQIYESNGSLLQASLKHRAQSQIYYCQDDPEELYRLMDRRSSNANVVLLSGGVSVGDFDYTKTVLQDLGVEEVFWRVAQKPGKPLYFGKKDQTLFFGLPGNPVSSWFCFHLYVLPCLIKMQGGPFSIPTFTGFVDANTNPDKKRTTFARGRYVNREGKVEVSLVSGQGSHMLGGLAKANCLVEIPSGDSLLPEKSQVKVYPIDV